VFAVVQQLLVVLAGLGFVCLVTAIFVVLAKFAARKLLDENDGSSL
jgi:cell division protein FtsL